MTKSTFHIFYYNILTIQWHFNNSKCTSELMQKNFLFSDLRALFLPGVTVETLTTTEANCWPKSISIAKERGCLLCFKTAGGQHLFDNRFDWKAFKNTDVVRPRSSDVKTTGIKWRLFKISNFQGKSTVTKTSNRSKYFGLFWQLWIYCINTFDVSNRL